MKKHFNTFVKTFFFTSLPMILLALAIYRRLDINLGYIRITVGTILISIFISLAISVFRSGKGKGYISAILGYIIIIPAIFVFRYLFGTYIFKTVWLIYILIVVIGIIYGIALLVVSKKYKSEVNELNRLLIDKDENQLKE